MPILKNAIKKLRTDVKRTDRNKLVRTRAKTTIKKVRETASQIDLKLAFSTVDKAAKKGVFHKKKADRIKSRLAKFVANPQRAVKVIKSGKKKRVVRKKLKKTRLR